MEWAVKWGISKISRKNAYGKGKIKETQQIPNFPTSFTEPTVYIFLYDPETFKPKLSLLTQDSFYFEGLRTSVVKRRDDIIDLTR